MAKVYLLFPAGEARKSRAVEFAVPPIAGQIVMLDGTGRRLYRVQHAFHGMAPDGRTFVYFAELVAEPIDPDGKAARLLGLAEK